MVSGPFRWAVGIPGPMSLPVSGGIPGPRFLLGVLRVLTSTGGHRSGPYASYWNAFLFILFVICLFIEPAWIYL